MSELQRLAFEEDGQVYEVTIDQRLSLLDNDSPFDEERALKTDAIARMQQTRQLIRGYATYAISAFKDFGWAEIEEVKLKFGLKLGGKTGIPYITEGSAESNLEIEVTCRFPDNQAQAANQTPTGT